MVSSGSLVSLDASLPCYGLFFFLFYKVESILLKLRGQQGYRKCLALGPAVQTWPRVSVSGRWLSDRMVSRSPQAVGSFLLCCVLFLGTWDGTTSECSVSL